MDGARDTVLFRARPRSRALPIVCDYRAFDSIACYSFRDRGPWRILDGVWLPTHWKVSSVSVCEVCLLDATAMITIALLYKTRLYQGCAVIVYGYQSG